MSSLKTVIRALTLGVALACGASAAFAADKSSPEDRARFVAIARNLEQAPLSSNLQQDRAWAIQWLTEAPDIAVTVCPETLAGIADKNYRYAGEIVFAYMFAMASQVIQHPEATDDPDAQQLAGAEGALKVYRAILKEKPDAKTAPLESLLVTQSQGGLRDFVHRAWISCSAKN